MAGREGNAEGIISAVPEADAVMEFDVEERTGKQKEPTDGRAELAHIERWKASRGAGREKRQIQATVKCSERSMQD